MRKYFAELLYKAMLKDDSIIVVTADLGFGLWDKIRDDFPDRFINVGAAEQTLLDIGVGLALSGKKPICYSITPFLLYRGFETIRTYINHESIPVILVGSGRGKDYTHDGYSHDATDDYKFMQQLENIQSCWPIDSKQLEEVTKLALEGKKASYINLKR